MSEKPNPTLREILAAPVEITVGGKAFMVQPMGWHQAAEAMEPLLPLLASLPAAVGDDEHRGERVERWAAVVMVHRDRAASFAALASGFPLEDVKAMQPTHFVEMVMGLVEVNADFFAQSLPELLKGARGRLARLMERWAPLMEAAAAVADDPSASTTSSSA